LSVATSQKTAALYTLIGKDKFYIILVTADGEAKSFASPIKEVDLSQKIVEFYAILQSPAYDPRPLGRDLYNVIFKPVEATLKKSGIQTLMWQLDGNLRYVPIAALFDGEKYLVERYQNVAFTRNDPERMLQKVRPSWTGTGFGSSQQHTVDLLGDGTKVPFPALPGVSDELQSIFRVGAQGSGILSGVVFTDKQFTRNAFYEAMKQRRPLVHISSHFAFRPGDDSRSFLLLGDGTPLTLNEMKRQEKLFDGVELLTLSACNTAATQSDASGKEIDGFAELAQRLGAASVMATLWQVSDSSTPWLMREFYRARQSKGGTTKAEALRNAQLALLNGTANTQSFLK
jgi:CHAT domain-containing protein